MSVRSSTLAFLGFGKPQGSADQESEEATRAAAEKKAKNEKDDDEDDEDEDEKEGETDDDREARVKRNGLRAAGERRGRTAERGRIAQVMNGVDPAKAEFALHMALSTDLEPDAIKAAIAKAPKGSKAGFFEGMAADGDTSRGPSFAAAPGGGAGKPSLASRMKADLQAKGWIK